MTPPPDLADKDALIATLLARIEVLVARVAELEAKLGLPPKGPDNSGVPPSRGHKASGSGKAKAKKKPHAGAHRALHPNPTRQCDVAAEVCQGCGADVSGVAQSMVETYERIEIPRIEPDVTRIVLRGGLCPCCAKAFKATPPQGLEPGSPFGPELRAYVIYLRSVQGLPLARLSGVLKDLFGLTITDMVAYWSKAEERFLQEQTIVNRLSAPVSLIVHSLNDVNTQLKRGRPFFIDLIHDGIALYEAPGHEFDPPKPLEPVEALKEAQGYFDEWFPSAERFLQYGKDGIERGWPKEAAFQLHQATERLYHCALLVLTLYSPKSHKLNFLRSHAEQLDMRLAEAWPRGTKFERRCFELLRCAYVDARYSPHYKISAEELAWLGERVAALQAAVKAACEGHLAKLTAGP